MNHIIALLMGVLLLVGSLWIRLGSTRARFWIPKQKKDISRSGILIMDERWMLVFLPALGLFFLSIGATLPANAAVRPWNYLLLTISLIGAFIGLLGLIWGLTNFYYPEGVRPAWLRAYYRQLGFAPSRGTRLAPAWYREQMQDGHFEDPRRGHKGLEPREDHEKKLTNNRTHQQNKKKRRPR